MGAKRDEIGGKMAQVEQKGGEKLGRSKKEMGRG